MRVSRVAFRHGLSWESKSAKHTSRHLQSDAQFDENEPLQKPGESAELCKVRCLFDEILPLRRSPSRKILDKVKRPFTFLQPALRDRHVYRKHRENQKGVDFDSHTIQNAPSDRHDYLGSGLRLTCRTVTLDTISSDPGEESSHPTTNSEQRRLFEQMDSDRYRSRKSRELQHQIRLGPHHTVYPADMHPQRLLTPQYRHEPDSICSLRHSQSYDSHKECSFAFSKREGKKPRPQSCPLQERRLVSLRHYVSRGLRIDPVFDLSYEELALRPRCASL